VSKKAVDSMEKTLVAVVFDIISSLKIMKWYLALPDNTYVNCITHAINYELILLLILTLV